MEKIVLEKSTNTHEINGDVKVVKEMDKMSTVVLNTNGSSIVVHGQHANVKTENETKRVIKITQQEFNPVTKAFMNAFD